MAAYALAEKRVLLLSHFLFKDLRQAEIDRIVKFARGESVDGGHVLFHKGDPARSLIGVLAGKIAITAEFDGQQAIFNVLGTGELFGATARNARPTLLGSRIPISWSSIAATSSPLSGATRS